MSRVTIVGAGYVGLVTGACFAELGHEVTMVDIDSERVGQIARGECPIYEPDLPELIARHAGRKLRATTNLSQSISDSEMTFIAVGTPSRRDGAIDLTWVEKVATEIGAILGKETANHVVVVKSTVVPGTADSVVVPALRSGRDSLNGVAVASNPEFLTEGRAVRDFLEPDRIVVGAHDPGVTERVIALYESLPAQAPRVRTSPATAEMIKYASNALLATAISFTNEVADLCASLPDTDIVEVMHGVHLSGYLSRLEERNGTALAPLTSYLQAGCGFGGSCLPKDVAALVAHGNALGRSTPLLSAVLDVNSRRADELARVIFESLGSSEGASIAVLGLAFKPDTDDVRETPAVPIIRRLAAAGARVVAHDPVVQVLPNELDQVPGVELAANLEDAITGVDAIVIVTSWEHYEELPELFKRNGHSPIVVDGRRMLEKTAVTQYKGIGLGPAG